MKPIAKTEQLFSRVLVIFLSCLLPVGSSGCRAHPHPAPPSVTSAVISFWEPPWHLSKEVAPDVMRQRYSAVAARAGWVLHSQKPYQEVEIPLTLRDNHAYTQVTWAGRKIECLVDTGASAILWPQWLHLDTHQLEISRINTGTSGLGVRGEWVLSPQIQIGDLTLVNVPTEAMGVLRPPAAGADLLDSKSSLQNGLFRPVLGWVAFQPGVVTIDYFHKRLIVRNRNYDVTRQPHARQALLIPYRKNSVGMVMLPGTLEGHKALFELDTGNDWQVISSAYARKNLPSFPIRHTTTDAVPKSSRST